MKKWLDAQEEEKRYVETGKNLDWGTPHSLSYRKSFLQLDKIPNTGVEIGCGPNGLYNFVNSVIGLDPINYHKQNFVLGVGEYLPFKSLNTVICCNGIDHFLDPQKSLDEMFRIAKNIIMWVYIYPQYVGLILGKVDKLHTFHFTEKDIFCLLRKYKYKLRKRFIYSFFEVHWRNTSNFSKKIKLLVAHLLGVRGLCIHMEVLDN